MPVCRLILGLYQMAGAKIAGAYIGHFPLGNQICKASPNLLPGGMALNVMHLVEVDVVGLQPTQGTLDVPFQLKGRKPLCVGPVRTVIHVAVDLCCQDDPFPPSAALCKPSANDLLRPPHMDLRGVGI